MKLRTLSVSLLVVWFVVVAGFFVVPTHGQQTPPVPGGPIVEAPKDLAGYHALENQIKATVAKVLPAVVGIQIGNSSGSGVIVSEDGLVMTAGHVVGKPGQPVTFIFADGKTVKGMTLGMHASTDSGMMKITDPGKWPFVPLGTRPR